MHLFYKVIEVGKWRSWIYIYIYIQKNTWMLLCCPAVKDVYFHHFYQPKNSSPDHIKSYLDTTELQEMAIAIWYQHCVSRCILTFFSLLPQENLRFLNYNSKINELLWIFSIWWYSGLIHGFVFKVQSWQSLGCHLRCQDRTQVCHKHLKPYNISPGP